MPSAPLRRNRDFVLFTAGQLTSWVGTGLLQLAVLLHVFASTHSTRATTLAFLAETVPLVVLSPWAGALADRLDRRRILMVADTLRAFLLLPLLVSTRLAVLLTVLAVQAAVGAVFKPAYGAYVPSLVEADQLAAANGVESTVGAALALLAPPAGGALFAAFGFGPVVVIDAMSFLISVLTLAAIRRHSVAVRPVDVAGSQPPSAGILAGWRLVWPFAAVRVLLFSGLGFALFESFLHPIFIPYLQGLLHANAAQVGLAAGAQAVGGLICGLGIAWIGSRLSPARMFALGSVGLVAAAFGLALAPSYPVALVVLAAVGVPAIICNVGQTTLLQTEVPDHLLGRAQGLFSGLSAVASIVGAAVPAFATGWLGIRGVMLAAAGMTALAATVAVGGARSFRPQSPSVLAQPAPALAAPVS